MGSKGQQYDERFADLARQGRYLHGEADLVDRLLAGPPGLVLDAGCGTGRVALALADRGYRTVGVDVDPDMLDAARAKAPDLRWELADLATADLATAGLAGIDADLVLAAGNVLRFVAPAGRRAAVRTLAAAVRPGGLVVAGFGLTGGRPLGAGLVGGAGPVLDLDTYDSFCRQAGLVLVARLATWEGAAYNGGDYAVSIHRRLGSGRAVNEPPTAPPRSRPPSGR